jgi:hypothetical protein
MIKLAFRFTNPVYLNWSNAQLLVTRVLQGAEDMKEELKAIDLHSSIKMRL